MIWPKYFMQNRIFVRPYILGMLNEALFLFLLLDHKVWISHL